MPSGSLSYRGNRIQANRPLSQLHPPPPYIMDDFLVDVIADDPYSSIAQSGTPITAAAISATAGDPVAGYGGWVAGSTDDVDAEIDEVSIGGLGTGAGTPWMRADQVGNGMLVIEWGLTVPAALTTRQYFVGVSDDPTEGTATNGALNITGTYTLAAIADDAAGFVFSSLASTPTIWKTAAVKATTASAMAVAQNTITQVANTWSGFRLEIDVLGNVFYSTRTTRGGPLTSWPHAADQQVTKTVLLVPLFTAAATTTTTVPWELDYCFATAAKA